MWHLSYICFAIYHKGTSTGDESETLKGETREEPSSTSAESDDKPKDGTDGEGQLN